MKFIAKWSDSFYCVFVNVLFVVVVVGPIKKPKLSCQNILDDRYANCFIEYACLKDQ